MASLSLHASVYEDYFPFMLEADAFPYIGEEITQLEHALQAAYLAELDGGDDAAVLAALFHDIGHMLPGSNIQTMDGLGDLDHAQKGADYLRTLGFPEKAAAMIEGHTDAKRYLVYRRPEYLERISPASIETLAFQGGLMAEEEAQAFEASPFFEDKLKIRYWEEGAKVPGAEVPGLEHYEARVERMFAAADVNKNMTP